MEGREGLTDNLPAVPQQQRAELAHCRVAELGSRAGDGTTIVAALGQRLRREGGREGGRTEGRETVKGEDIKCTCTLDIFC